MPAAEAWRAYERKDYAAVLEAVSSANIACGFHAGDPRGMRAVCREAAARSVAIGAHPGYRDLAGFGRRRIEYDLDELSDEVIYQVAALQGVATHRSSTPGRWYHRRASARRSVKADRRPV